jgi:hypothetical protein
VYPHHATRWTDHFAPSGWVGAACQLSSVQILFETALSLFAPKQPWRHLCCIPLFNIHIIVLCMYRSSSLSPSLPLILFFLFAFLLHISISLAFLFYLMLVTHSSLSSIPHSISITHFRSNIFPRFCSQYISLIISMFCSRLEP